MTDTFERLRDSRVLVTGGLGFIGRNLVDHLTSRFGCAVTLVDDLSNASRPDDLPAGCDLLIGDVRDRNGMAPLVASHPWIFHLACRNIFSCGSDPASDLDVNAGSTLLLLELLRERGSDGLARFVYTSSTSIYGNSSVIPTPEDEPPQILSHYAGSKYLGEQYALLYHRLYGVPTAVVRYSNVFGPYQTARNPYCGVPGKFLDLALAGETLPVHGDGAQTRDYTFVDDAVEATLLAAVRDEALGDVFNVGTGVETSVNELAAEVRRLCGPTLRIEHVAPHQRDNIRRRALDPARIRSRLGWEPRTSVADGLRRTLEARREAGV